MANQKTLTSSNRFYITTGGTLNKFIKKAEGLGENTFLEADHLVARIASSARKNTPQMGPNIQMGGTYHQKWSPKKGVMLSNRGSRWNNKTGTWVSRTYRTGNGPFRLTNFNFETTAWKRKYGKNAKSKRMGYSEVSLTSQIANLWEYPAIYSRDTRGLFQKSAGARWGGWPQGRRSARPFFYTVLAPNVNKAMPKAIDELSKNLDRKWNLPATP